MRVERKSRGNLERFFLSEGGEVGDRREAERMTGREGEGGSDTRGEARHGEARQGISRSEARRSKGR